MIICSHSSYGNEHVALLCIGNEGVPERGLAQHCTFPQQKEGAFGARDGDIQPP